MTKISVEEYAKSHNPVLTRRGHVMSSSYLYRLIRQDISGELSRTLWFSYVLEGEKERIYIILD